MPRSLTEVRVSPEHFDAIAEQETLEERHNFLANQVKDLSESKTQLEQLISKLINQSREKFLETFEQIRGFGEYGFPESHAASFALLVYASAWLKCHHPAAFACALLDSQPMGFYAPAQIVRDARDHGASVRGVDVGASAWDCTLEEDATLRLGFRVISGFRQEWADAITAKLDTVFGVLFTMALTGGMTLPWVTGQAAAAWGLRPALFLVVVQFAAVFALQLRVTAGRAGRTSAAGR